MSTPSNNHLSQSINLNNNPSPLRDLPLDTTEHIWIAVVVLIPVIVVVILCIIAACIYRYKKRRTQQNPTTPIDQQNVGTSMILNNSQNNAFLMEELPPSYDLISETKKDLQFMTTERFQLPTIKEETAFNPPPAYTSDIINSSKE